MRTAAPKQTGDPGSIAALEALMKSRFDWANGVVSPFALAGHHRKFRGHPRRRLSSRAKGNDLRGSIAPARR
jgi:hypothetical protein